MQIHPIHKNTSGFTLIELVIAVAIIGILTSVAVLGYNQYKVRAYDAHSKQALRDILLQCNAFWLDQDASKVCNHATVAEVYVASDEIVLKFPAEDLPDLPGGSQGNFCASAQHVSSPNTYSIDSASLISEGGCGDQIVGTKNGLQLSSATEKYLQSVGYVPGQYQSEDCGETGGIISPEVQEIQKIIQFLGDLPSSTRESDPARFEALDEMGVFTGQTYAAVQKDIEAFCASLAPVSPEPQAIQNYPLNPGFEFDQCKEASPGSCLRLYPISCERLKRFPTGVLHTSAYNTTYNVLGRGEWTECPSE